jgi:GTP-binding protein LepA
LIFDSVFNSFRGIIAYFRVMNGSAEEGRQGEVLQHRRVSYNADEVGCLKMDLKPENRSARGRCGLHHQWHQDRQRGEGG